MAEGSNDFDVKVAWIGLHKAAIWPVAILLFMLAISGSLGALLRQIPSWVDRASAVQIGDVRVELSDIVANRASPSVRNYLENMTIGQIIFLFELGNGINLKTESNSYDTLLSFIGTRVVCEGSSENKIASELIELGLSQVNDATDISKLSYIVGKTCRAIVLSNEGNEVRNFLSVTIKDLFSGLPFRMRN